jgi:putative sterol carrier protein
MRQKMSTQKISIPRPSEDITPSDFFEQWLPENITMMRDLIKDNAGELEVSLGVRVTGEGGGDWSVVIASGEVGIQQGLKDDATITLILSEKNFVEAVSAQFDDLLPGPDWLKKGAGDEEPAEIAAQIKNGVNMIKPIKGSLLFRADDQERPFEVLLKFQGELKDKPDTEITISQDNLRAIASGETSIINAFMSGEIKVDGTMNLIMNFAPLVMKG